MAHLRNPGHTPALGLPVLAILAEATRENIRRTISLGASHVVIRPFSAADLFRRIDGVLNQPIPQFSDDSRSEEHTSELQSLMRISYAVFCLNKKNITN